MALALRHLQLVYYAERTEDSVGANSRNVFIHRTVDLTVERDVPIDHDDADRSRWIDGVFAEHGIAIDGS